MAEQNQNEDQALEALLAEENIENTPQLEMEVYASKAVKLGPYAGRFGGKSTQVCVTSVEYHGLSIEVPVWARLSADRDTQETKITIEPGLPTGLKIESEEMREQFMSHVLASASVWVGYKSAEDKAIARLTDPVVSQSTTRKVFTVQPVKR